MLSTDVWSVTSCVVIWKNKQLGIWRIRGARERESWTPFVY